MAIWQYGYMAKATFTLDDETLRLIRRMAERTRKPQSLVVREAVAHYAARDERMTADERQQFLETLDELATLPATRSERETDREIGEIRAARRRGGRLHRVE